MSSRQTVASALALMTLAVMTLAVAPVARAGDLGPYPEPRSYEDEYGAPPPRDYVPPRASTKDEPLPPPPRYSEYRERAPACTPRHVVLRRLEGEGWRDFHDPVVTGPVAVVLARRPSGDLYRLRIDRCSGEIVGARIERRAVEPAYVEGPYVEGPRVYFGPRRWGGGYGHRGWGRRYW